MGKLTRRTIVLAALCAGALAALLAYLFLDREQLRAAEMTKPVPVVVAAYEIPVRTVIEPGMVRETTRPVGTLPTNCASSLREVVGKVTVKALAADEPVRRVVIAAQTAALGLSYVVPPGMRAVTVAVDPIIGVAGFLKAGDHVDVVATFGTGMYSLDRVGVTKTVLQDVELLAIGPDVVPEEVGKPAADRAAKPKEQPNATLAVSPGDAERLILAESQGKLRLILRRAGDDLKVALSGAHSEALTGARPAARTYAAAPRPAPASYGMSPWFLGGATHTEAAAKAAEKPQANSVETIRGTQKSTVEVRSE